MRVLAEFIMRGRMQAAMVMAVAAALPATFGLSAAAGSLVLLQRGLNDTLSVLLWAVLPALLWWYLGDPQVFLVLIGTFILALVLRQQKSWNTVFLLSIALGVAYSQFLGSFFASTIEATVSELQKNLPSFLEVRHLLSAEEQTTLASLIGPIVLGLMASVSQTLCLLALMLGRYWQGVLYNPGGFGREFQAFRFSGGLAAALFALMLLAPILGVQFALLTPLCSVPLVFAGVALVHGLAKQGSLSKFWLIGFYVSLLLLLQLIYPLLAVLAVLDSFFDFRKRAAEKNSARPSQE